MAPHRDNDVESSGDEKARIEATSGQISQAKSASEVPWTVTRVIAIISLCFVYVGAQSILYMTGGTLTYIGESINTQYPNWLLTSNTLAVTAICPFVGYITDLLGRRWVTIFGSLLLIIASVVQATSKTLASSVIAQALGGIGAGICELTALAGVAEITPVRWRGVTLAAVTFSILPFIPYILYIEELHAHSTWRWALGIAAIWNGIGTIGIIFCYHPPPRHNVDGLSAKQVLGRIDWGGAFLSISGVALFITGLQLGGYQEPWTSAKTLAPLIIGIILIIAFGVYEVFVPKHPMVPTAIFKGQNVVLIAYIIVFIAGMIFYSVLGFFPIMLQQVWPSSPGTTGFRGLWYPLAILIGACVVSYLMSYTRGYVSPMFIFSSIIMTAFCGALASATPFNVGQSVAFATLASLGIGGVIVPALTLALYACPDAYIGTTAALSLAVRFLGGSVGTTIYFNIFNTAFMSNYPKRVIPAALAAGLPETSVAQFAALFAADPAATLSIPGVTMEVVQAAGLQAQWALTESLKGVWYASVGFGVVAILASCAIPNIRRFQESTRVAVDLH